VRPCGPAVIVACAALTTALSSACTTAAVVTTSDTPPPTAAPTSAPPQLNNLDLANAHDFYDQSQGQPGYYFATPSGKWRCAILPRSKAGCQAAHGAGLGVAGEPDTVDDGAGNATAPNAIVVESAGDGHFAAVDPQEFALVPGPPKTLPLNEILAAAGFRCNVQEAGVSCLNESTGSGFTFSTEGYSLQYTEVPAGASP
jgi:hypothetical protein